MAGVIRLIVIIILAVLALLSVFLLLLMSASTGIEAVGVNGEVGADLRCGVLRVPIYPRRKKGAEPGQGKLQKPKKPKKQKKTAKYKRVFNKEELDIGEILGIVMDILEELGGTLNISRLRVRILIGTDDAAKTGILLGYASALIGMAVPFFENTFEMKDYHINVDADFDADHTIWAFDTFLYVRPIRIISILLRHSPKLFRLYKRLFKKVEAETNE